MREQKKEPTPAKGLTRIGNYINGIPNLGNPTLFNNAKKRRSVALLKHTLVHGCSTYLKVLEGLERKNSGVSI